MGPLVLPDHACTFHPIQAVTADAGMHSIQKEASEIGVGDIVFCNVQPIHQYYCHLVLRVENDYYAREPKYWIGNIQGSINGWCNREHIFGILVRVEVTGNERYYNRPFPKDVFEQVKQLVKADRWSTDAKKLCEALDDVQQPTATAELFG